MNMPRPALTALIAMVLTVVGIACSGDSDSDNEVTPTPAASIGGPSPELPGVLAFSSDRGNGFDLYTVTAADGSEQKLTGPGDDREPSWSPDGQKLAFQSTRDGVPNIYIMNADGKAPEAFRPGSAIAGGVRWSPDGDWIAYYSFEADTAGLLWVAEPEGADFYPLLRAIHPSTPDTHCGGGFPGDWIDNETILFRGAWAGGDALELCTIRKDETELKAIYSERGVFAYYPDLSPDGTTIAFSYKPENQEDEDVYLVDVDGKNPRRLLATEFSEGSPTWSPDGEWLAFTSNRDGDAEIYAIRADGSDLRQLTNNDFPDLEPSWSPVIP